MRLHWRCICHRTRQTRFVPKWNGCNLRQIVTHHLPQKAYAIHNKVNAESPPLQVWNTGHNTAYLCWMILFEGRQSYNPSWRWLPTLIFYTAGHKSFCHYSSIRCHLQRCKKNNDQMELLMFWCLVSDSVSWLLVANGLHFLVLCEGCRGRHIYMLGELGNPTQNARGKFSYGRLSATLKYIDWKVTRRRDNDLFKTGDTSEVAWGSSPGRGVFLLLVNLQIPEEVISQSWDSLTRRKTSASGEKHLAAWGPWNIKVSSEPKLCVFMLDRHQQEMGTMCQRKPFRSSATKMLNGPPQGARWEPKQRYLGKVYHRINHKNIDLKYLTMCQLITSVM